MGREESKENIIMYFKTLFEKIKNREWISVREHSLSQYREECGLSHNWGSLLIKALEESDWILIEGERSGMKYKRNSQYKYPDFNRMAERVLELKDEETIKKKRGVVIVPGKETLRREKQRREEKIIGKRTHFNVDDICYTLWWGKILECEVRQVGIRWEVTEDGSKKYYAHDLYNENEKGECTFITERRNTDIFESPQQLINYLSQNVIRRK